MNGITLIGSVVVFVLCADRLRLMNWHTVKIVYVAMHLAFTLWALGTGWASLQNTSWHSLVGIVGVLCYLVVSKETWKQGPPPHTLTKAGGVAASRIRDHA